MARKSNARSAMRSSDAASIADRDTHAGRPPPPIRPLKHTTDAYRRCWRPPDNNGKTIGVIGMCRRQGTTCFAVALFSRKTGVFTEQPPGNTGEGRRKSWPRRSYFATGSAGTFSQFASHCIFVAITGAEMPTKAAISRGKSLNQAVTIQAVAGARFATSAPFVSTRICIRIRGCRHRMAACVRRVGAGMRSPPRPQS